MLDLEKYSSAVLEEALRLLGPNGEYWITGTWRVVNLFNPSTGELDHAASTQAEVDSGKWVAKPCFCGEGAIRAATHPELQEPKLRVGINPTTLTKREKEIAAEVVTAAREMKYTDRNDMPNYNDSRPGWLKFKASWEEAIKRAKEREAKEAAKNIGYTNGPDTV